LTPAYLGAIPTAHGTQARQGKPLLGSASTADGVKSSFASAEKLNLLTGWSCDRTVKLSKAKQEARDKYGVPCPVCVERLPKAHPSILLPQQRCKIHGYRDPRQRTEETEYLKQV